LRARLTMEYTHTGEDDSWPGGPYVNYVRVLAQSGAKLTGATVRLSEDAEDTDIFETVVVSSVGSYTSFELPVTVQPQTSAIVTLTYDLPQEMSLTPETQDYKLYWQKQAGTQDDSYYFAFHPPLGLTAGLTNPRMEVSSEEIYSEGSINTDKEFYIALH
jgi:hypothetical protein